MAGQVKGITISFRGDTTKLDKALRQIKSDSKSVDAQLKEVNRALRFNPKNAELLRQKFDLLGKKVNQTENELKQLRNVENQLKAQNVSKQSAEWMKVRREIIQAESKLKHFNAELKKAKFANMTNLGNSFKSAGASMRSAGMYATIGGAAMVAAGKKLLDLNATQEQAENKLIEIYKKRMGVNEEAAKSTMKLASAIQKEGVIGDEVTLSGAQQLATFAKMPSTVNKLLPAMDNLLVQQKGYNATADDAKNIANLFGKAMQGQVGSLKRVGISFTDAQAEILKTGTEEERAAVLAQVVTDNVGDMNKAFAETDAGKMQQVKNSLGDFGERLGAALLPALASVADWLNNTVLPAIEKVVSFVEGHPIVAKIAVGIAALLTVGGPLLIFIGAIISAIGTIMTVLPMLSGAFTALTGPIGLVIAAIAAAIAIGVALYKNWDTVKATLIKTWNTIKAGAVKVWNAIKNAIMAPIQAAQIRLRYLVARMRMQFIAGVQGIKARASAIFNAINTAITHPIQTAANIIRRIVERIKGFFHFSISAPHIPLPHFTISPAGWRLKDLLKGVKPKLGINWYAKGGIFDSPSVIGVGEGTSPEAVVPLDKFWKKIDGLNGEQTFNFNITINDTNGLNAKQIAAEVEQIIIQSVKRKKLAWT